LPYGEADAIAELTASYSRQPTPALNQEHTRLMQELENACDLVERRLCTEHLGVLNAELARRGKPAGPPAPSESDRAAQPGTEHAA
jgi:hypothetical protein